MKLFVLTVVAAAVAAGQGLTVVGQSATGRQPGNPAIGFGSVWVPSSATDTVERHDPKTGRLQQRIQAGTAKTTAANEYFDSVAVGATAVWAASDYGNDVVRIDPHRNAVVRRVPVPGRPGAIAVGPSGVYVSLFTQPVVLRLDPATGKIVRRASLDGNTWGIAFGAGAVWALSATGPTVEKLDPVSLAVRKRISIQMNAPPTGGFFTAWWISAGDSAVCATNQQQNAVTRIDPAGGKVVAQTALPFGANPFSVAADGDSCWAVNNAGVFRVAAKVQSVRLPRNGTSQFEGVAAAGGKAWVTLAGRSALVGVTSR